MPDYRNKEIYRFLDGYFKSCSADYYIDGKGMSRPLPGPIAERLDWESALEKVAPYINPIQKTILKLKARGCDYFLISDILKVTPYEAKLQFRDLVGKLKSKINNETIKNLDIVNYNHRLKYVRKALKISQEEIGRVIKRGQNLISKLEEARVELKEAFIGPIILFIKEKITKPAELLDVDVNDFETIYSFLSLRFKDVIDSKSLESLIEVKGKEKIKFLYLLYHLKNYMEDKNQSVTNLINDIGSIEIYKGLTLDVLYDDFKKYMQDKKRNLNFNKYSFYKKIASLDWGVLKGNEGIKKLRGVMKARRDTSSEIEGAEDVRDYLTEAINNGSYINESIWFDILFGDRPVIEKDLVEKINDAVRKAFNTDI